MTRFVESPIYDNWFAEHLPKKELILCTPYIKQKAFREILKLYNMQNDCREVELKILIRGNAEEFNAGKSSDISVLDSFINLKRLKLENVRRVKSLHMKAYLIDREQLLITSGNLTNSGLFVLSGRENFEGGIATDDKRVISAFLQYFDSIWEQGEAFEAFYAELLESYKQYISTEYSDKKVIKRIKRSSYEFACRSRLGEEDDVRQRGLSQNANNQDLQASAYRYTLDDLPPVGDREYVHKTLEILKNNPQGLKYTELGRALRESLGLGDLDNMTSNRKFGEEKGKYLVYFNLASLIKSSSYIFKISKLGEVYLQMEETARKRFLNDQLFSKPVIVDIIKRNREHGFDLNLYLSVSVKATKKTLNRKIGTINKLLDEIRRIEARI